MEIFGLVIVGVYILLVAFVALYSLAQLHLLWTYLKHQFKSITAPVILTFPDVTIQLPIYNELYVVERLIDTVCAIDYPIHKLEIQVIDDSDDETSSLIASKVEFYQKKGYAIKHLRRKTRNGYKAGALSEATRQARGEYIAIFDADFLPQSDFLFSTIPYFNDKQIGVVQTRWGHINPGYSILTKVQGFALDAHFSIEQTGRNKANHFINFNGTAGIWRKVCIEDAGGWQSDTLTEDLDLSYRAQLKGWKFKYLEHIQSPAELPVTMPAIKSQQYRWSKGAAEVSRKLLWRVIRSDIPFMTKFHAIFHLLNSFVYIPIFFIALMSVPVLCLKNRNEQINSLLNYTAIFLISMIILGLVYFAARYKREQKSNWIITLEFLYLFPSFLSLSMGLALHNSIAVLQGYFGKKSSFVRTPKFNINENTDSWKGNKYVLYKLDFTAIIELLMALYFVFALYKAIELNDYSLFYFHLLQCMGYCLVFYYSMIHSKNRS